MAAGGQHRADDLHHQEARRSTAFEYSMIHDSGNTVTRWNSA